MFTRLRGVAGLLLAAGLTAQSAPIELVLAEGSGALYRCGEQRLLLLKGSPHEIGRQHGKLLAAEVRLVTEETLAWTERQGLSPAALQQLLAQATPFIPRRYEQEMAGLAAGSGVPLARIRLLHAMPSYFHCTGLAAAKTATKDGKLYHLRSLDYALDIGTSTRIQNHAVLIVREPEDGLPHAVPSWAGFLGAVTGLNGAGISVGEMGSHCKDEDHRGVPMVFQVQEVLRRATTLAEAVAVFHKGPSTAGYHFVIGSGDERDAAAVEVTRRQFQLFELGDPRENIAPHTALPDLVRRSNHFVAEELAKTQRSPYDPRISKQSSWEAYARMTAFCEERRGQLDTEALIELLRRYPREHGCLHQAVMAGTDRWIWVANAADERKAACAGAQNQDFYGYDLRALLARREGMTARVIPAAR